MGDYRWWGNIAALLTLVFVVGVIGFNCFRSNLENRNWPPTQLNVADWALRFQAIFRAAYYGAMLTGSGLPDVLRGVALLAYYFAPVPSLVLLFVALPSVIVCFNEGNRRIGVAQGTLIFLGAAMELAHLASIGPFVP